MLKQRFTETLTPKKMKEAIVRMMYAEMLGHDASFGHIHAVNMTQQTTLQSKRVGYLASAVCLHAGHELTTLLVNTQRRDLKSSNYIEVCASLIAIPKLVNEEVLPALLPAVVALLEHPQEVVRKKAVMCLHRFYQVQPACVADLGDTLRRVLCDKDPAVMGASLDRCLRPNLALWTEQLGGDTNRLRTLVLKHGLRFLCCSYDKRSQPRIAQALAKGVEVGALPSRMRYTDTKYGEWLASLQRRPILEEEEEEEGETDKLLAA